MPKNKKIFEEKKIKIALKELPKKAKQEQAPKPEPASSVLQQEKQLIAPPLPKGSQLQKIVKKPILYEKKAKKKTPQLNKKNNAKKFTIAKKEPLKTIPKRTNFIQAAKIKKQPKSELDWLFEDRTMFEESQQNQSQQSNASAGKNIKELYGDEFGKLSVAQQEYILDNMEIMRRITQEILNRQASVSNLENIHLDTSNVIEFYLHPNGNMSDFRFLKTSNHFLLDTITKNTIEFAYSKYPRPKEKTLIRYNVFYFLR